MFFLVPLKKTSTTNFLCYSIYLHFVNYHGTLTILCNSEALLCSTITVLYNNEVLTWESEYLKLSYTCPVSSVWTANDKEMKDQIHPTKLQECPGAVGAGCCTRKSKHEAKHNNKAVNLPTSSQEAELQVQVRKSIATEMGEVEP